MVFKSVSRKDIRDKASVLLARIDQLNAEARDTLPGDDDGSF
ncbi:MAG: hypothetical protein AABW79_00875 [Nanoarchaeota archaeon]